MKIAHTLNHGKPRWRVNVQRQGYRKRLFFETYEEATAFAEATGGPVKVAGDQILPAAPPHPPSPPQSKGTLAQLHDDIFGAD